MIGTVYGERAVIAHEASDRHGNVRVRWRCSCGAEGATALCSLMTTTACMDCRRRRGADRLARRAPEHYGQEHYGQERVQIVAEARQRAPEVWLGDETECRDAVRELAAVLGPCSLEEVAALLGVSREHARQIEAMALRNLRRRLSIAGVREAAGIDPAGYMEGA